MESKTDKAYKSKFNSISELENSLGKELGLTEWFEITQEKINVFAEVTEDLQWIHLDIDRCIKESPYKSTIAHGFLMLSMCSKLMYESYEVNNIGMFINYGLDKVRFTNATPAGSFYRGRLSLLEFNSNPSGAFLRYSGVICQGRNMGTYSLSPFIAP